MIATISMTIKNSMMVNPDTERVVFGHPMGVNPNELNLLEPVDAERHARSVMPISTKSRAERGFLPSR
jgi:hypothetical protein